MRLVLLLSLILINTPVAAEDSLLDILNSNSSDSIVTERSELIDSLKKILGEPTAEQNIFLTELQANRYDRAFYQWRAAFQGTTFEKLPTGQALYAFLMFQNGLKINGLETLFKIEEPKKIGSEVQKIWNLTLAQELDLLPYVNASWNDQWTAVFNSDVEAKLMSWTIYDPTQTEKILSLISKTKLKTNERHWLQWQLALGLALQNDMVKAGKVLADLLKSGQTLISQDLVNMTAARLLYEKGFLSPAISYYKSIPKSSEYWFEAQEEISWAYLRKGEPQNTLAVTKSLMVPAFAPHVGPESVFLRSLAQLKICDYAGALTSIKEFRQRFRPRTEALLTTVSSPDNPAVQLFIEKAVKRAPVSLLSLGDKAKQLPRYITRDEVTYHLIEQSKRLKAEAQTAGQIYGRSMNEASSHVGFQAQFEELKSQIETRHQTALNAIYARIKNLAEDELEEIHAALQKMHIVEAEVIQQVGLSQRVVAASQGQAVKEKLGTTGSKDRYSLRFPFEGELWFDEIDNYKVDVKKDCQAIKR